MMVESLDKVPERVTARPARIGLVTNFAPHYRRQLFAELGQRMDLSLILTSRGKEWYWQGERSFDGGEVPTVAAPGMFELNRVLRQGRFDAIVAGLTGRATLLAAVWTARRLKLPLVLWVEIWEHPRTFAHRFSRPAARSLYRSADAIVAFGTHVAEFVRDESGRADDVFVVEQAVENKRFRTPPPTSAISQLRSRLSLRDAPTFTFVGRIVEEKGLDILLKASAQTTAAHQIVVAGTGPLLESISDLASSLGISERVRFAGHVSQSDLPTLLWASDALVLPSIATRRVRETWGLVANEAMNCGLPVLATDAVGAAAGGLVIHRKTGLIVPERDVQALASALAELALDESMRRRLGQAARAHVLEWNYTAAADGFCAALAATGIRGLDRVPAP